MTEEAWTTKKFICPVCEKAFTSRAIAKSHMNRENHKGAVVVSISKPTTYTPPKPTKWKKKWKCPVCKKIFKTEKAATQHMIDVKHKGTPVGVGTEVVSKKKEPKPEPEPEPPKEVNMWCRLSEPHWLQVKDVLERGLVGIESPETGNHLIQYTIATAPILDYLMFIFDFVEIEMEIGDVLFAFSQIPSDTVLKVKDIATLEVRDIKNVSVGGFIIVEREVETSPSVGLLTDQLSSFYERDLACVGGDWKKKITTTTTTTPPPPQHRGRMSLSDMMFGTEEEDSMNPRSTLVPYGGNRGAALVPPTREPIRPPAKPLEKKKEPAPVLTFHPVYKVSDEYIYTDRVVDYSIYTE